jgi:aspartate kinase
MGDFLNPPGTLICDEEEIVEQSGRHRHRLRQGRSADLPAPRRRQAGRRRGIFGPLAEANINVDMIVQNISEDGKSTDMTFTVPSGDVDKAFACSPRYGDDRLRRSAA